MSKDYDQLDYETEEEYQIFLIKLENPSYSNTQISKVWNNKKEGNSYSPNQITSLSKINKWDDRLVTYHHDVNLINNYVSEQNEIAALIEFQERQKNLAARLNTIANDLLSKAAAALDNIDPQDITANTITKFIDSSIRVAELGLSSESQALMLTDLISMLDRDDEDVIKITQSGELNNDLDLYTDVLDEYERLAKQNKDAQRFENDKDVGLE